MPRMWSLMVNGTKTYAKGCFFLSLLSQTVEIPDEIYRCRGTRSLFLLLLPDWVSIQQPSVTQQTDRPVDQQRP